MAFVDKIEEGFKNRYSIHKETQCTYFIVHANDGAKYLQLETDGSKDRQILGKVSQSIQFSPDAIKRLKEILAKEFPD